MIKQILSKAYKYCRYAFLIIAGLKLSLLWKNMTGFPVVYDVFITKKGDGCICVIAPYYSKGGLNNSVAVIGDEQEEYVVKGRIVREPEQACLIMLYKIPNALKSKLTLRVMIKHPRRLLFEDVLKNDVRGSADEFMSISTLVKFESAHLEEWIEHHLQVGVGHFYIYDNNLPGEGGVREAVDRYMQEGIVTYISWPYPYRLYPYLMKPFWPVDSHMYTQIPQMHHVAYKYAHKTKWILACDVDEYFYSQKDGDLTIPIREHASYAFLRIQGFLFGGTAANRESLQEKGVIGSFTRSEIVPTSPTKLIFDPMRAVAMSVHEVIHGQDVTFDIPKERLVFNHYRALGWKKRTDEALYRDVENDQLSKSVSRMME